VVSVFYGIQCSLSNFELSATIMTYSSPDDNTSVSKTVWLVHTMVRKIFPSRGSCLTRLSEPESHPCSVSALLYHRISHQLNKIYRKHYRSCVTHLCTSETASHKPLSNNWLVLCVRDAKLFLLQEVVTHVTELRKPPYCMTISVTLNILYIEKNNRQKS
jgi:hypothetical protein